MPSEIMLIYAYIHISDGVAQRSLTSEWLCTYRDSLPPSGRLRQAMREPSRLFHAPSAPQKCIIVNQKPTVFPPGGFREEVFGVQAAKDENTSGNNGDEIRGYELPAIALIVVSRGIDGGF